MASPLIMDASSLVNGNALYSPAITRDAAATLNKNGLDRVIRHMATIDFQSEELDMMGLSVLGAARAYDIVNVPGHALAYATNITELDALSAMTDPGPQLVMAEDGTRLPAGALVTNLIKAVREAQIAVAADAAAAAVPMGRPTAPTSGGLGHDDLVRALEEATSKKKEGKAKDLTTKELNALRDAFKANHQWAPERVDHGDCKALGLVRYWMEVHCAYAGKKQLDYLTIKSAKGGEQLDMGTKLVSKEGEVEAQADSPDIPAPTNSTQHIERFARKLTTILLYMGDKRPRVGQKTGDANPTTQVCWAEVNAVLSTLRGYYTLSKANMARAIESYEEDLTSLIEEQTSYTMGGALLEALPALRLMLKTLKASAEIMAEHAKGTTPTKTTTTDPDGTTPPKKRSLEKAENEVAQLKRQLANVKNGGGQWGGRGYGGRGHGIGNWYAPNPHFQYGKGGKGGDPFGKGGNTFFGGGGRGGGVRGGGGGAPNEEYYERMAAGPDNPKGGNPKNPYPCRDYARGNCKRALCAYKHE